MSLLRDRGEMRAKYAFHCSCPLLPLRVITYKGAFAPVFRMLRINNNLACYKCVFSWIHSSSSPRATALIECCYHKIIMAVSIIILAFDYAFRHSENALGGFVLGGVGLNCKICLLTDETINEISGLVRVIIVWL